MKMQKYFDRRTWKDETVW